MSRNLRKCTLKFLDPERLFRYVHRMADNDLNNRLFPGKLWPRLRARLGTDGRALLAVSGGSDSLALLHLVLPEKLPERSRLVVGYVHHGTGDHADKAEAHVREAAGRAGVAFRCERVTVDPKERKRSGFEAVARRVRYEALERLAEAEGCSLILTGHTLDDRAEGVLLFLFRGAGTGGLAGARESRGCFWRPLQRFTRDELARFLRREGVVPLDDPTNDDLRFTRNRIRKVLKPLIVERFGAGSWRNLAFSAERLAEAEEIIAGEARKAYLNAVTGRKPGWIQLETDALRLYLQELQVRVLRLAWKDAALGRSAGVDLPRGAIRRMLGLLRKGEGSRIKLPAGVTTVRTSSGLVLNGMANWEPVRWTLPGSVVLPDGTRLEAEESSRGRFNSEKREPGRVEYMDADVVGDVLLVRHWREGDRFEPLGSPGSSRKVARILSGFSARARGPVWVAESGGLIVYLVGRRIAHSCRVRPNSRRVWRLTCTPPPDEIQRP